MPNLLQKLSRLKKFFELPQYSIPEKKSGFLNKVLRPRSLRSLAPRGLAGKSKLANNGKFNVLLQSTFDLPQE